MNDLRRIIYGSHLPDDLKLVLLAYSDFGNADGTSVHPGAQTVADALEKSKRTIQRATGKLRDKKVLVPSKPMIRVTANDRSWLQPRGGAAKLTTTRYRIDIKALQALPPKPPRKPPPPKPAKTRGGTQAETGDMRDTRQQVTPGKDTGDMRRPDTGVMCVTQPKTGPWDGTEKAPRADAPACAGCGKPDQRKRCRPPESATFAQAVVIVQDVRRRFPALTGGDLKDAVKCDRARLGFTTDELDGRKLSGSQVDRAIDADEHVHPRPRLVVSPPRRAPPTVEPITPAEELFDVDEARRRGLFAWGDVLGTMPRAHAEAGVIFSADGTLTRLFPYRDVRNYDAVLNPAQAPARSSTSARAAPALRHTG